MFHVNLMRGETEVSYHFHTSIIYRVFRIKQQHKIQQLVELVDIKCGRRERRTIRGEESTTIYSD